MIVLCKTKIVSKLPAQVEALVCGKIDGPVHSKCGETHVISAAIVGDVRLAAGSTAIARQQQSVIRMSQASVPPSPFLLPVNRGIYQV